MAQVVVQLINDAGDIESKSTVIAGTSIEEAEQVMARVVDAGTALPPRSPSRLVTELHYQDGDVGCYDELDVSKLWAYFTKRHEPSHIVIRPDTEQGQQLSNQLFATAKMSAALNAMVDAINATGGVIPNGSGFVPAADDEWFDLGLAYTIACEALGSTPQLATGLIPE